MRITQTSIADQFLYNLQKTQQGLLLTQEQLSSGKRILLPENDPAGTAQAMQLQAAIGDTKQYIANDASARSWLQASASSLGDGVAILQKARDLAVQAGSAGTTTQDMSALADSVSSLQSELLNTANAQWNSQYLFAGRLTSTQPYAYTAGTTVTYAGDAGSLTREIGPSLHMSINTQGGVFSGALATVAQLQSDLQAGLSTVVLQGDLSGLDAALTQLQDAQALAGAGLQRLTVNDQRLQTTQVNLQDVLGTTQNLDVAGAIVQLQQQQTAYQEALAAGARLQQTTLLTYLHP